MAVKAADITRAEEAVAFARPISRYEAIRRDLLICDAERALLDYFGLDSSERIICPEFEEKMGFPIEEALDSKSENYLLGLMADRFEERMGNYIVYYREAPSPKACWEAVIEELVC